ncbi:MAG: hypothetical protein HY236_16150 [Acidobacteria bacterium]|nr:hypothetical protein [Acidobacteriota bacterium]
MLRLTRILVILSVVAATGQVASVDPPGGPLEGITAGEFELFRLGLEDFSSVETAEDGLGPAFNAAGCSACHNIPAVGGFGTITEVRAGRRDEEGRFIPFEGGTLFHLFSLPPHTCQARIPPEANVIARRISIPLFGAGLVEAIPDESLLALEDPEDRNQDGIRGRAARIHDVATDRPRIGRFGWKAQQATLLAFGADAYRNEMGITNDLFREEVALGVDPEKLRLCDPASDPEDLRDPVTGLRGIDKFEVFLKFLAPPPRGPIDAAARRGEQVFAEIGCASCHIPELRTAPSSNPAFDRKPVRLFSDLLLHDIGTGDEIEQAAASGEEIRTPALWGLRFRRPFLHDGSAPTPEAAIRRHDREAARGRERFLALPVPEREALLAFLRSL